MKRSGYPAVVAVLAALLAAGPAFGQTSQDIKFASTPNPVGSGGRAVGWGGAFIAVADDATAASWNPAGLVQLETPECSVVLSYLHRGESVRFEKYEAEVGTEVSSHGDINYASMVYPFHVGSVNLVPSLNYQRLVEFDRKLEFSLTGQRDLGPYGIESFVEKANFEQTGALTTVTPALAAQITPMFSLGASFNFWGLDPLGDGWTQETQSEGRGTAQPSGAVLLHRGEILEKYRFSGWNWQLGLLLKPGNFTIGAVYKASFDADIKYDMEVTTSQFSPTDPPLTIAPNRFQSDQDETITWPASYGVGVAYRFSDAFSMAVDAYRTEWSNFELEDEDGNKFNLIAGRLEGADIPDTMQVRGGMEYLIIKPKAVVALRGGAFYDPEPREDRPVEFYGVALGTGVGYGHFAADIAYQFRFGFDVPQEQSLGDQATADVFERFLVMSLIYHF